MFKQYFKIIFFVIALSVVGCAKRGSINGGLKDTLSPVLKVSFPKNYSTGFKGQTFKLTFNEYVKLKNANKQLIVSPPMTKTPEIAPSTASKTITITIRDTLQPNTTYSFNFGQSIEDNNEGNPYPQFKYVFSTGTYIDSLSLSGTLKDAYNKDAESFISVMLYEINDKYNDSIIYKENPRYITNTLDSAKTFKLENLKAGKYLLIALKDENNNYRYEPKIEKIGFHKEYITIPNDTIYQIELFKEAGNFRTFKPSQASGNRLIVGYEGNPDAVKMQLKKNTENLSTIITRFPKKDSLQVWYKPIKLESKQVDSLQLEVTNGKYIENFLFKIKNQKNDTLSFSPRQSGVLPLGEKFTLGSSLPLAKFDSSKMKLINKDSVAIPFKTAYNEMTMELEFDFAKEPMEKYKLELLPGALTDYLEKANDTLSYKFETKSTADYGNLRLTLENVKQFPVIIELTNKNGDILYSAYAESNPEIDFNLIKPDLYTLRLIYDENKNKVWDPGNFLKKTQSEEVIYFPKEIDVRANWDVIQPFNLKQ